MMSPIFPKKLGIASMDGMAANFFAPVKYTLKSCASGFKIREFSAMMKINCIITSAPTQAMIAVLIFTFEAARRIRRYTVPPRQPNPIRPRPRTVGRWA